MAISLEDLVRNAMVDAVRTVLASTQCRIQFYATTPTSAKADPSANRVLTGAGLPCTTAATGAMPTAAAGGSAAFGLIASATVSSAAANVQAYAVLKNSSATPTTQDIAWVGSVGTSNTFDMSFNTTNWANGDNISISSLTFTQP